MEGLCKYNQVSYGFSFISAPRVIKMGTMSAPLTGYFGFTEPQIQSYQEIFGDDSASLSRGGGYEDIKFFVPERKRRAGGFFSYFTKTLVPWIKPIAFKLISNVMGDLADNKDQTKFKDIVKRRGLESIGQIAQKATRVGGGGGACGKKRKTNLLRSRRGIKRKRKMKKRTKEDIFTSI